MTLQVGDTIPEFSLTDQYGKSFNIDRLLSQKSIVLYFYPKNETVGCTKQACAFRDNYQDFQQVGAEVIGISSDSEASHNSFADHYNLPFILLSDTNGEIRKKFGVKANLMGLIPGRTTYIIDKQGIIRYIFNSQIHIEKHISEALRILNELQ